ncbi:MAG: Gfo/Idh/MocA family oxidoreductase [Sedimentisphaerales bacterium]|nr:Gfo/Idh/MocA family oxidoreductase [Sedimentisphaerales bacterium]
MNPVNRRDFLKGSIGAAATVAVLPQRISSAANEKISIGVMGLGGRGTFLAQIFAKRPDTEIAYLCDADSRRFGSAAKAVEDTQPSKPKLVQDFRRILDDKNVDVLINATPDHWHGLGTIMACRAGKDVYVEKPMSHNVFEGSKMVEAARKYNRVVQVGMQTRSAPYMANAKQYVQSGRIGDVHLVRVFNMMKHGTRPPGDVQDVPDGFDYDMWCGPAAKPPYNPSRYWLNFSEYSCGPIPGDAIHQLDLARFLTGDKPYPDTVAHAGGIIVLRDGRDTPDTQLAMYEYGQFTLQLEAALWTPYMKKTPQSIRNSDAFPDWPFSSTRIELFGTDGFLYVGRHGGGWVAYDSDGKIVHSEFGRQADAEHRDNFIDCIRTRKKPNADVQQGHYSALLCHLANISCRLGNRKLAFDAKTESFLNAPDADKLLKRTYRDPWKMPNPI